MFIAGILLKILGLIVPLLLGIAFMVLAERKVMGSIQRRKGPNVVGTFGLLQPIADGLKLMAKEPVLPSNANLMIFLAAPVLTFMLALISWAVIPFGDSLVLCDLNIGVLYLFAGAARKANVKSYLQQLCSANNVELELKEMDLLQHREANDLMDQKIWEEVLRRQQLQKDSPKSVRR